MRSSHTLDRVGVIFDDSHAVANAGLMLSGTLAAHLGIEALTDELVDLGECPGAPHPGRKLMTLIHALIAGGDSIEDCDLLRCGSTAKVVGHRVMAPSTVGTFLRSFTFGHVRQLDRVSEAVLARAWQAGAGPGDRPMTIDLDSTVCEVHGYHKQGAAYGYTRQLGYHPLLATRAATGEVLHVRQRIGSANTARGAIRFLTETVNRARRSGASGSLSIRADSGFWSKGLMAACNQLGVQYSITVRSTEPIRAAIEQIPDDQWTAISYTEQGQAEVAETTHQGSRLIVRRTRLVGRQAQLWPQWRHHGFVTNRQGPAPLLDLYHRSHATIELDIRDLKQGSGLNHCPSGSFSANSAWLVAASMAHNLVRWVNIVGSGQLGRVVAQSLRRRLICLPGRITHSARRTILHLPRNWPWRAQFEQALVRLRAVQLVT